MPSPDLLKITKFVEANIGEFLEKLAIYVCTLAYKGWKSGIPGIDLELDRDGRRYIVSIKSGPNWGNSEQIKKLRSSFKTAAVTLRTSNSKLNIRAVNGCCYGRDNKPDKGDYEKLCGQRFWEFMSGDANFYTRVIEPVGHQAKKRNDDFAEKYDQVLTLFSQEFAAEYCVDGKIDWSKIVVLGSSSLPPKIVRAAKR